MGVSQNEGELFTGPSKNYNILGSILGSPYLGKLPYFVLAKWPKFRGLMIASLVRCIVWVLGA